MKQDTIDDRKFAKLSTTALLENLKSAADLLEKGPIINPSQQQITAGLVREACVRLGQSQD